MITTVIFDFDGTLADTSQLIVNSFNCIYKKYYGEEKTVEYISQSFGEPLRTTIEREFNEPFEEVVKDYRDYQFGRFDLEVKLFSNSKETLEELMNRGIKMGIVTSRLRNTTDHALKLFNIDKYFKVIVPADEVENHKPHPEPLLKALKILDSRPEETLFIGDSRFDIECAKNAGAASVLVGWHNNLEQLKKDYKPKHIINDMNEIIDIINNSN